VGPLVKGFVRVGRCVFFAEAFTGGPLWVLW